VTNKLNPIYPHNMRRFCLPSLSCHPCLSLVRLGAGDYIEQGAGRMSGGADSLQTCGWRSLFHPKHKESVVGHILLHVDMYPMGKLGVLILKPHHKSTVTV